MHVDGCEICSLDAPEEIITETDHWVITLNPNQGYLGRCYVRLKDHKSSLSELSQKEWADFQGIVTRLERAIRLGFDARVFNWACLMNDAFQKDPATPHVHWHLRPRYDKTVVFDNIEFHDPSFGHFYLRPHDQHVPQSTYTRIQQTIRENF